MCVIASFACYIWKKDIRDKSIETLCKRRLSSSNYSAQSTENVIESNFIEWRIKMIFWCTQSDICSTVIVTSSHILIWSEVLLRVFDREYVDDRYFYSILREIFDSRRTMSDDEEVKKINETNDHDEFWSIISNSLSISFSIMSYRINPTMNPWT